MHTTHRNRPPLAELGAWLALVVSAFLIYAQWTIYPAGYQDQINGMYSLFFATVILATALRIAVGNPGVHRVSTGLMLLAGVGLVLRGLLADHSIDATAILETACGALTVLSALVCLVSPNTELPPSDQPAH